VSLARHAIVEPAAPVAGYAHLHAAHCESGVSRALLREAGATLSEPLIFGIGSGLFFVHVPQFKVMGHPLTSFRSMPGGIFTKAARRLGMRTQTSTWYRRAPAMQALDAALENGHRVGLQVNIFWLPYIPKAMRVHFNGHNLIALERRGDAYIVSDPIMEDLFECPAADLERARFSGGPRWLPKGRMYRIDAAVSDGIAPEVLDSAVAAGLEEVCHRMLRIPKLIPIFGLQAIRYLARRVAAWPAEVGERQAQQWLAGIVRMQEEIGTGGAGFRFLFAAFLQEAGRRPAFAEVGRLSEQVTAIGDDWRAFALQASRRARGREAEGWQALGERLLAIADAEQALFEALDVARKPAAPRLTVQPRLDGEGA
jgi:hypothetical protein